MTLLVRPAVEADVPGLARVQVRSWRETYRGLMSDDVLDDPGLLARREHFWTAALTDERYAQNKVAAATTSGEIVGVAMSGPPLDDDATWDAPLYVLYTYAAVHGLGAGSALLTAVIGPSVSAAVWVAEPNPRGDQECCTPPSTTGRARGAR